MLYLLLWIQPWKALERPFPEIPISMTSRVLKSCRLDTTGRHQFAKADLDCVANTLGHLTFDKKKRSFFSRNKAFLPHLPFTLKFCVFF